MTTKERRPASSARPEPTNTPTSYTTSWDLTAPIEPLLWLLGRLADGVKLTQTGALPRAVVRDPIER